MLGFPHLSAGGVRCSMSYLTLLPVDEGATMEAGQYYEYNGTFIAPLDSISVSMAVGYGQHVWVDYIQVGMLHNGSPDTEYECTTGTESDATRPCIFPFLLYGNIVPYCSSDAYYAEGFGWCAISVEV
jgi:hypothetical protein